MEKPNDDHFSNRIYEESVRPVEKEKSEQIAAMAEVVRGSVDDARVPELLQGRARRQLSNVQAADSNVVVVEDVAWDRLDCGVGRGQKKDSPENDGRNVFCRLFFTYVIDDLTFPG